MLLFLFLTLAFVQLIFWWGVLRIAYQPQATADPAPAAELPALSVIVCFRNEEKTLARLIELILSQDYPATIELLLVDDNSTDNSASVVHPFVIRNEHVQLLAPGPTRAGKKDALTFGIESASHETLVLTDADCLPASNQWLRLLVAPLQSGKELVLGASPSLAAPGAGLLARWQRFESIYVSLKYLGFARRGHPYMGVGRNMAYTKSFFRRAGGFSAHADLPGGDDDLLVSASADPARTGTVVHPGAWVYTHPQPTWRQYFRQRARHQSTGGRYPKFPAFNLTLLAASHGLFYLLAIPLLWQWTWPIVVLIYVTRLTVQLSAFSPPYFRTDPATYPGAPAGAKIGWAKWTGLAITVATYDVGVAIMYLYLALAGAVGRKSW